MNAAKTGRGVRNGPSEPTGGMQFVRGLFSFYKGGCHRVNRHFFA